jgi:predicted lipoprotein with Yx(FWY)xxD motif
MKTPTIVWALVVLVALLGGWYWWSGTQNATAPSAETQTSVENTQAPATATPILNLNLDSKLAQYLADAKSMTLYTYSKDTAGVSNCSGTCATNWPPYTVAAGAALTTAAGISGAVGTIARADGMRQVTYKGMPLYLWVKDVKPGDVTGNGVGGFITAKP